MRRALSAFLGVGRRKVRRFWITARRIGRVGAWVEILDVMKACGSKTVGISLLSNRHVTEFH